MALDLSSARQHWFQHGSLQAALFASGATPGLTPLKVEGRPYLDGGALRPVPLGRAAHLGADTIYVLTLLDTSRPVTGRFAEWETGPAQVVLRWQLRNELANLPAHIDVHILPLGGSRRLVRKGLLRRSYGMDCARPLVRGQRQVEDAYQATLRYLRSLETDRGANVRRLPVTKNDSLRK